MATLTLSAAKEWYEVDLPSAAREPDELPDAVREEAHYLINALAEDPKAMRGLPGRFRFPRAIQRRPPIR